MLLMIIAALAQSSSTDIVVNGTKLSDASRQCIEHGCATLRDAQVSIALAEQQFRAGTYLVAKKTLAAAVARNHDHAAADPKPVAALYEAYATVALHDGDLEAYRKAVSGRVRTLRDNLPPDDPAVTDAALAVGDMWAKLGNYVAADRAYESADQRATAAGQTRIALLAAMRRVSLATMRENTSAAREMLSKIEARPGAQEPDIRTVIRVLRLRMAARGANDKEMQRLITEVGQDDSSRPTLIWAPSYQPSALASAEADAKRWGEIPVGGAQSSDYNLVQWADIGFWIRPDGRTDGIDVLRGSPGKTWTPPLIEQISGRRYTASGKPQTSEGVYRVERFTLSSEYRVPQGSLIRRRAGPPQLQVLDLTASPAKS